MMVYIVSGWSNLSSIYKALDKLDLYTINHIVCISVLATKSKFVSAHYHIFYISKNKKTKVKFNKNAYLVK
jgi:predicted membrane channel-forming protein YqfA (hemolysin III family)